MKTFTLFTVFVFYLVTPILSQNIEEREVSAFDKLKVSNEIKVYLTKGNEEKVKVVVTGIDIKDVHTIVDAKTLEIELSRGIFMDSKIEVFVTYKELREITAGSSAKISVQEPLIGDKIILNASSGSEITAELNLRTIDVKVGQGASIRLNGKTGSIDANISTAGILAAIDLQSDSTYVRVGSTGIAKVKALLLLDANIRTGGTLTFTGNPVNKKITKGIGVTVNEI